MEIGGLVAHAFKVFLGNPDVITVLSGWSFIVTLVFVSFKIYEDLKQ